MKRLLRRPSPAMIIAVIALVAALGGTAIAGGGFLTKGKFNKFKNNALQRLTYATATANVADTTGAPSTYAHVSVNCPAGLHPVGGGIKGPDDDSVWWGSGFLTTTGYTGYVFNGSGSTVPVTAEVACVAGRASGSLPSS